MRAFVFEAGSPIRILGLEQVEAFASFAILQWIDLEWPFPDLIVSMPDADSLDIGQAFASMLQVPFVRALTSSLNYVSSRIEEEQIIFLFGAGHPVQLLQKAEKALLKSLPKKIYLISLYA